MILCGDYNIAHKEIDIHNPKGNKKTSGFLPEERAWMDKFYRMDGWIHFVIFIRNRIDTAGGASVFQVCVYKTKDGELIILM